MSNSVSFKVINRLAIPSILAGIIEPVISITDTAIIGHIKEFPTESLAAVGIVGSFMSALFWILGQTKNAVSTIISQKVGASKLQKIYTLVPQILGLNVIFGLFLVFVTYFLAEDIFRLYSAKDKILELSIEYYKIRAFGLIFTLITFTLFGIFRGLQNTFWAMMISLTGGLINIVLDFVLVYGIDGFVSPMGIKGAAWASLIAQFTMMLLAISFYAKKTPFGFRIYFDFHPEIPRFFLLTYNLIIRTIALNFAIYLSNRFATSYGKEYIAAHVIATNIWLFTAFFIDGYADAGNSLAGKLSGAKDFANLKKLAHKLIRYGFWVASGLTLVFLVFKPYLGKMFTSDPIVLQRFYEIYWLLILILYSESIAFIFDGIFKGLGWVKFLRNMQLVTTLFVFIPSLLLMDYLGLKLWGIWVTYNIWMISRAGALWVEFSKNLRKYSLKKKYKSLDTDMLT